MLRVLDGINLIGDSIYLLRPIRQWLDIQKHELCDLALLVSKGLTYEIFHRQFGTEIPVHNNLDQLPKDVDMEVIRLEAGTAGEWCALNRQRLRRNPHISEGFAAMLGVEIDNTMPPLDWVAKDIHPEKEYILLCPFSRSCSRHSGLPPNKTLDDWKWNHIIAYLRRQDIPVKVMGAPGDRFEACPVADSDYLCGTGLTAVQTEFAKAHFVISVDSGLGHLASCFNLPTVIFWPVVMAPEQIAPLWAPRTSYIQMDPHEASPSHILQALRPMVRRILDGEI